jgi:F-type H+-transporting ATPase subunit alpha
MKSFDEYLHQFNEVGAVIQVKQAVVELSGLPGVGLYEVVVAESGELGYVTGLSEEIVEVLLFTRTKLRIGVKMVRTGERLSLPVGDWLLGEIIDPLGRGIFGVIGERSSAERRELDQPPLGIERREDIWDPFETGVVIVDTLVPLGKGQRELVIGDRKIGKTFFLQSAILTHAKRGGICVYAGIARRAADIYAMRAFVETNQITQQLVMVTTVASDPSGMVFITPYAAMTVAEYFRDQGKDVLCVLDDLTIHAKYYREIGLLSHRYPGRSAYPGDIFYTHARLMERAGNFDKGSITCLPVAETVLSDIRGYIQTNLMSMTDGHVFFSQDMFNKGIRPAVDPFLSVTRVGRQTRSPLLRDIGGQVTSFLVHYQRLQKLVHFGGELSGDVKRSLALGDQIWAFFNLNQAGIWPLAVAAILLTTIMANYWDGVSLDSMASRMLAVREAYLTDARLKATFDGLLAGSESMPKLVIAIKPFQSFLVTGSELQGGR